MNDYIKSNCINGSSVIYKKYDSRIIKGLRLSDGALGGSMRLISESLRPVWQESIPAIHFRISEHNDKH